MRKIIKVLSLIIIFTVLIYSGVSHPRILDLINGISHSAEIFPSTADLSVMVKVTIERNRHNKFDYRYMVTNSAASKQTIDMIQILNPGPRSDFVKPLTWHASYSKVLGDFAWHPSMHKDDDGAQNPPLDSIDPGESSDEFGLLNHDGPPMISKWQIMGWAQVPIYDSSRGVIISNGVEYKTSEWADTILNHSEELPNSDADDQRLLTYTLGPSEPPADNNAICDTFLIGLMDQIREAVELGWIKEDARSDTAVDRPDRGHFGQDGTYYRYTATLGSARHDCMRGNFDSARKTLRAALKQVEAQRGKQLTDEGYYLIKFNVEYLLEKL